MYGCESWTINKAKPWRIDALNCGVGEDSWQSIGLQGDQTSPSWRKSILNIPWKDWCWSWISNTLPTWCKELTHKKRPRCWERLKEGEGDDRGWDGWMASLTQWTWVWVSSGRWWRKGKLNVLQSMGLQRVKHYWATKQQQCPWVPSTLWQVSNIHFLWLLSDIPLYGGTEICSPIP